MHFLEGFFGGGLWGFGQSVGRGTKRAGGSDFRAVLGQKKGILGSDPRGVGGEGAGGSDCGAFGGQKKGILGSDPKGYGAEWGGAVSPLWLPVVLG